MEYAIPVGEMYPEDPNNGSWWCAKMFEGVWKCSGNVWEMFDDVPAILFHSKTDSSNVHYSELSHIRGYYS